MSKAGYPLGYLVHLTVFQIEHLRHCTANAVLEFVRFADAKAAAGTMKKRRWILPGLISTRRWLLSVLKSDQASRLADPLQSAIQASQYPQSKDPGHLPPSNAWERLGDRTIMNIPRILRSTSATFGFRVACAVLTVAIPDFLHDSGTFFIHQRGLWAEVGLLFKLPSAICLTGLFLDHSSYLDEVRSNFPCALPFSDGDSSGTTGLSLFGYLFRLIGTVSGAATSLV